MTKRHWLTLFGIGLFLVGVLALHPAVHWRVIGCVRGEAFYLRRPTSWWEGELRQWEMQDHWHSAEVHSAS